MNLAKKRRLASAGWKETSVKEFLSLSDADAQYIEMKLALSRRPPWATFSRTYGAANHASLKACAIASGMRCATSLHR